jgi:uncharacterized protein YkwD
MSRGAVTRIGAHRTRLVAIVSVILAVGSAVAVARPGAAATTPPPGPWDRPALPEDYGLLVLANEARADPAHAGYPAYPVAKPMVWSDTLAAAARFKDFDQRLTTGCHRGSASDAAHNSCDGTNWITRISGYYGATYVGENIATTVVSARVAHSGWMNEGPPAHGHRDNIMNPNYAEFGAGLDLDTTNGFRPAYATEDFGNRGMMQIPAIPAGAVFDPVDWYAPTTLWRVAINYYDSGTRTPTSAQAIVDGLPVPLSRVAGTPTNGTWSASIGTSPYPSADCKKVSFRVTRSDGQTFRWPAVGAIGLGFGCRNSWQDDGSTLPPPTTTSSTVSTTPTTVANVPVVTIDAPHNGDRVAKTVQIRAHMSGAAEQIEIVVDGKRLVRRRATSVVRGWNAGASAVKVGPHTITVNAWSRTKVVASTSITVVK